MRKNRLADTIEEGLRYLRGGRIDEAAKKYRQVLSVDPNQPDALHFMGVIAHRLGNFDDAVELIAASLRVKPNNSAAINNLAGVLKDQGRLDEAVDFYQAAIEEAPDQAHIYSNLGNALKDLGRYDEAVLRYHRALQLDPHSFAAQSNLGTVYKERGQLADAVDCYRHALRLNPHSVEALSNLGVALKEQGRLEEAEKNLLSALKITPKSDAVCTNLGTVVKELGRIEEAIGWHLRALELNPQSHYALNNLGSLLKDQGRFAEAVDCFEKAIRCRPQYYLAHNNLGSALVELGRSEDAIKCFRRAVELRPAYHQAFSNLLFTLNYLPGTDRGELFAEHQKFDELYAEPLRNLISLHTNSLEPERRLRVGFVSGDLRDHPVAFFMEPVFARHSAESFELFCYSNHSQRDAVTARLQSQVENWREIAGVADDEVAAMIRQDRIDILVDLSGHTARNRLLVFARKPAPIQVTMIGYMQTTGLRAMDYRITDKRLDPPGQNEAFHTEKLMRIEAGAATFAPPSDCPPPNELPALREGHVTFGAFNNLAKVTPEAIAAWAEILRSVPSAHLLVVGRKGGPVQTMIAEHGIDAGRVEFIERLPMKEFLALHHRVDVLLDTFPYNGGTTNLLAIWMGVPFVSMQSESGIGRAGASLLEAVRLPEFIGTNRDDYVRRAIAAAGDLPQLAELRASLRSRLEPLLEAQAYTSQLETAFREMWRTLCVERYTEPSDDDE